MARIACFGEILLRLGPERGVSLRRAGQLEIHVGGAEANVAVGLALLGHASRMVSALPDNPLGDLAADRLRQVGVDPAHIVRAPGRMGLYFLDPPAGPRAGRVIYDRASSVFADAEEGAFAWDEALAGAVLCHASGITAALGPRGEASLRRLLDAAKISGCLVSFDCNYRASLWEDDPRDAGETLRPLVGKSDILFGNYRDAETLLARSFDPGDPRAASIALLESFPRLKAVVSTHRHRGEAGGERVSARMDRRDGAVEAEPVSMPPGDGRIGTGDAFAAGVLHGVLQDRDDATALAYGLRLMAIKHATNGDMPDHSLADLADHGQAAIRR